MGKGAQASLADLRRMLGHLRVVEGTNEAPTLLERKSLFGYFEVWKWVSGKGTKALFQQVSGDD